MGCLVTLGKHPHDAVKTAGRGGYLDADNNSVRWSDGCIVGYGYGGTMAAVVAHHVRLARRLALRADGRGRADATWLAPMTPMTSA